MRSDDEDGFLGFGDDEDAEESERDRDEGYKEEYPRVVGDEKGSSENQTDDLGKRTTRRGQVFCSSSLNRFGRERLTLAMAPEPPKLNE